MKKKSVKVWGPATVANWGPGFDLLGASVSGLGDTITIEWSPEGEGLSIVNIQGDGGKLPRQTEENTAGIAALKVKEALNLSGRFEISIKKGLPLGSGLGSSAASAAAAAMGINLLAGTPLTREELIPYAVDAEAVVSGRHADNVAPALLGGFVLLHQIEPFKAVRLPVNFDFKLILIIPELSISTKTARKLIPKEIPLTTAVKNSGRLAAMIAALYNDDLQLFLQSLKDEIVEPVRADLIPGFWEAKETALQAGAGGFTISGSGPTMVALAETDADCRKIGDSVVKVFHEREIRARYIITSIDEMGAREIKGRG